MNKNFTQKMTILFASVLFSGATAFATVDIEANETYTQNFDAIGTEATATLPTGWKADKSTNVRTVGTYAAGVSNTERQGGNRWVLKIHFFHFPLSQIRTRLNLC